MDSGITLELEDVDCALCGAKNTATEPYFQGYDTEFRTCDNEFTFVQCARCGHLYLSPRPREADIGKIYSNYLTHNTDSAYHPSKLTTWVKRNLFDRQRMKTVLDHLRSASNVLEIGAGSGQQLEFIGEVLPYPVNFFANDIFFDASTRQNLQDRGVQIVKGFIEHDPFPETLPSFFEKTPGPTGSGQRARDPAAQSHSLGTRLEHEYSQHAEDGCSLQAEEHARIVQLLERPDPRFLHPGGHGPDDVSFANVHPKADGKEGDRGSRWNP